MDCRTQLASMAIDEVDKGDFEMATKILTTGIRVEPNNHELYFERSICHHKLANYQASLDDANAAIRLNSSDYNIHYQKGLALIGLSQFSSAVTSFKKAIELRAKQDDSKLSDIFKLLRDATNELNTARRKPGALTTASSGQARTTDNNSSPAAVTNNNNGIISVPSISASPKIPVASAIVNQTTASNHLGQSTTSSEPVDSTTDKPSPSAIVSRLVASAVETRASDQQHMASAGTFVRSNGTVNNLVATNPIRNHNQNTQSANQQLLISESNSIKSATTAASTTASPPTRVSSSATAQQQPGGHYHFSDPGQNLPLPPPPPNSFGPSAPSSNHHDHHMSVPTTMPHPHHDVTKQQQQHQSLPPTTGSFEWNIRRSERIFLHNSSEPGTSGPHDETGSQGPARARLSSNPSSVSSGRAGATKRPYERALYDSNTKMPASGYPPTRTNGTNSVLESEIDVDDSSTTYSSNIDASSGQHTHTKRVMVTPSSSMPATSQQAIAAASGTKEDSYSSKYKRLRRDRERARRGTSKLCTIKPGDLDELHKMSQTSSEKRFMRVIAPIDGWLYSGQLSVDQDDGGSADPSPHYVVKLDGDSSGSSYLFTQETVLNDVIKEVRVKSVSELRKGARICCYWSRTYKCLSTGVVTSRTFEATKSLVSVKYDNGDLSALPLEDLRLLPPDYPKYMSNCDPLLLAKNGDTSSSGDQSSAPVASPNKTSNRIVVDCKSSSYKPASASHHSRAIKNSTSRCDDGDDQSSTNPPPAQQPHSEQKLTHGNTQNDQQQDNSCMIIEEQSHALPTVECMRSALDADDDDDTIPPTDETINFITSEVNLDAPEEHMPLDDDVIDHQDATVCKDNMMTANATAGPLDASRASSEENNYGIEYRPWEFEGPSKHSKRNGRTYRYIYSAIRRGNEVLKVGDSAELMPRDESIPPFVAKIDGLWATCRGEMRVRVRWYYRLSEAEGEPYELEEGENALFETDHFDENDIQSIWRTTKILSWTEYIQGHSGHINRPSDGPKIFYLAGHYDPVRCVKHLRSDVKSIQ